MKFNKGDILWGKGVDAIHPILFIKDMNEDAFKGCMLTTKDYNGTNIPISEHCIKTHDSNGKKFRFQYNDTHIVNTYLVKSKDWKPFNKVGEFTNEGLQFIETKIKDEPPIYWDEYLNNCRS